MRPHFFFFIFVFMIPFSYAFDCNYFSDYQKEECIELQNTNESLVSNLVYNSYDIPDHDFVYDYNKNIDVNSAPDNTEVKSNAVIKNAWLSLLYLSPSIEYQDKIYVPDLIKSFSEYNYEIKVPDNYYNNNKKGTCKILYSLNGVDENLVTSAENQNCNSKECTFSIEQNSTITSNLELTATIKEKHYDWYKYCCSWGKNGCRKYCYKCKHTKTTNQNYNLNVEDSLNIFYYDHNPNPSLEVTKASYSSYKAELNKDNETSISINFNNSYYNKNEFIYSAEFIKEPFELLQIKAEKQESSDIHNILKNGNNLYVKDKSFCSIEYSDFFKKEEKMCSFNLSKEPEIKEFEKIGFSESWNLLLKIVVFIFVNILLYKIIKNYWFFT